MQLLKETGLASMSKLNIKPILPQHAAATQKIAQPWAQFCCKVWGRQLGVKLT